MEPRSFPIGKVSDLFLDRTSAWVRWQERIGHIVDEDGNPIGTRHEHLKKGGGDRVYSLTDVRLMAHALRRANVLDDLGLEVVIARIEALSKPVFPNRRRSNK